MNKHVPSLPDLAAIRAAAVTLQTFSWRTPLVRLNAFQGQTEIYLKLENLQSIGAYKVRCMANLLLNTPAEHLQHGVYTASSGNAGLALAAVAQRLAIPARVFVPHGCPAGKLEGIRHHGAEVRMISDPDWWSVIKNSSHADDPGLYADAVRSPLALAGNATLGLEIIEQLPEVDTVIAPFGGGGLACGVSSAFRLLKPGTRIIAAESAAARPLTAAFEAGGPVTVPVSPSFISGAGGPSVLDEMWPLIQTLIDDTRVVPVKAVADAIRHMAKHNHIIAEGAGAIAVAAAMADSNDLGKTVCIVSGGNIDTEVLADILTSKD